MWEYNQIPDDNDYLAHYGVLGMKWGVRRGRVKAARAKAEKKTAKLKKRAEKAKRSADVASARYFARASMRNRSEIAQRKLARDQSIYYRKQGYKYKTQNALDKWNKQVDKYLSDEAVRSVKAGQNSKALYKQAKRKGASSKDAKAQVSAAKKSNPNKYATTKDKQKVAKQRQKDAIRRERERTKRKKKR